MVVGVTEGYSKTLEIVGIGYRVAAKGTDLEFALGFSHPVVVTAPEGITFTVERPTLFSVAGIDKQQVGEVAANIRKLRKPDPYKGKGVRYRARSSAARSERLVSSHGARQLKRRPRRRASVAARARRHFRVRKKVTGTADASAPGRHPLAAAHLRPGRRRHRRPHAGVGLDPGGRPARRRGRQDRQGRARSASSSPSGPRPPASTRSCSTAVATATPAGSRRWPTAPAKRGLDVLMTTIDVDSMPSHREGRLMPGPQRRGGGAGGNERRRPPRPSRRRPRWRAGREDRRTSSASSTINRVAKVVKGGRRFSFTALVVVGDGDGTVGVGYGKAKEVPAAIAKGVEEAKKHFFKVPRIQGTIPHPVQGEEAAGVVLLQAGPPRYRRHRRWSGARRAGVRRHPRRALASRSARPTRSTSCTPPWRR